MPYGTVPPSQLALFHQRVENFDTAYEWRGQGINAKYTHATLSIDLLLSVLEKQSNALAILPYYY